MTLLTASLVFHESASPRNALNMSEGAIWRSKSILMLHSEITASYLLQILHAAIEN